MSRKNASQSNRHSDSSDSILFFATLLFFLASAIFGGADPKPNFGLALIALSGLILIFTGARYRIFERFGQLPIYARLAIIAPFLLPLIQLIPLPPAVWQMLPGQELRLDVLDLVGIKDSWQTLSLKPGETAFTAAMGLFFAIYLLALSSLSAASFDKIIIAAIGVTVLGIGIGIAQFSGGVSAVDFYRHSHKNTLIGFFSNKNHMGLILAVCLIFWKYIFDAKMHSNSKFLYWIGVVLLLCAVLATNSRAGIALTLIALMVTVSGKMSGIAKRAMIVGFPIVAISFYFISSSPTFELVYKRFYDVTDDVRWQFLIDSMTILKEYFLLGSGYGSFSDIYITRESIESLRPVYTNHLHNDYLQLILEGGMLGVGAFILMVYTIIAATVAGFKNQKTRGLVLAGAVTVLLFGLHSIVDYPLRRPAAVAYFGIGLACLLRSFLHITGSGNQVKRSQSA